MWWPFQWLFIYVLGGLTFVPLAIISVIGYVLYGSVPVEEDAADSSRKISLQREEEKEQQKSRARGISSSRALSGWLTVRRQFRPSSSGVAGIFISSRTTDLSGAEIQVDEKEDDTKSLNNGVPTTYSARIAQTYRQMVESRQAKKDAPPKEYFFCVLKGAVLFLYDDEAQSDCIAAIGVDKYVVSVENSSGEPFNGKDAEMFSKRTGLVMRIAEKGKKGEKSGLPALVRGMEQGEEEREMENAPWFLFTKSNTNPNTSGVYSVTDMKALVDTIDTEPDPIPMRWLNAMLGRIFFGLYRTEALEQLSKVPRPSFLGPIVVREVNVGTFPPILSKPMLKDLTAEGTAAFEVNFTYRSQPSQPNSEVRITIATTATIPTGFKPYVVDLVLAVLVKKIEGNLMIQIKKPPSNRVWYGFTQMPKLEVEIRPIVSERKIQIGMVLKAIEKQLRDVIAESIVLPYMDDIAFFNTTGLPIRGGIFSEAGKIPTDHMTNETNKEKVSQGVMGPDMSTAAEDPASAIPETSTMRKRHPTKALSLDVTPPSDIPAVKPVEIGLPRTDTAPALVETGTSGNKEDDGHEFKKWFAKSGRTTSFSSQTVVNGSFNTSQENLSKQRSHSGERAKTSTAESLVEAGSASESSTRPPSPPQKGSISFHSLGGLPTDSSNTLTIDRAVPHPENAAASPSTAALLTSLRARDKKAIQSQVNTARDAVKKRGVGWAAKRRTNLPNKLDEREEDRPAALYRPPDDDAPSRSNRTPEPSDPPHSPTTLKERLDAAAQQATTRERSASSASGNSATGGRPNLFQSPTKSTIAPVNHSTSPPNITLASSRPIIDPAKASVPAANAPRSSSANGVYTQPSAGRSMVVPRVPKRPGEVTGMGSHPESGMIRRISTEDRVETERDDLKPALPPRRSSDRPRSSNELVDTDIPSKAEATSDRLVAVPGPENPDVVAQPLSRDLPSDLPTRRTPIPPSSPPMGEELLRADSAPPPTTATMPALATSLPIIESGTDSSSLDQTSTTEVPDLEASTNGSPATEVKGLSRGTDGASQAEDALRMLSRRNQAAILAQHPEEMS